MDDYYFIYKDSTDSWRYATNPAFIAQHTYCRALPKNVVKNAGYTFISDFVYDLNENLLSPSLLNYLQTEFNITK